MKLEACETTSASPPPSASSNTTNGPPLMPTPMSGPRINAAGAPGAGALSATSELVHAPARDASRKRPQKETNPRAGLGSTRKEG